jgi:hypothetical protein
MGLGEGSTPDIVTEIACVQAMSDPLHAPMRAIVCKLPRGRDPLRGPRDAGPSQGVATCNFRVVMRHLKEMHRFCAGQSARLDAAGAPHVSVSIPM